MVLDITQSSLTYAAALAAPSADAATVGAMAVAIQNAAHLCGGLWVVSITLIGAHDAGVAHRMLAVVVVTVLALHTFVVPLVPAWWALECIGLPLFFAWTGVALLSAQRHNSTTTAIHGSTA